jgi:TPR repeat protein
MTLKHYLTALLTALLVLVVPFATAATAVKAHEIKRAEDTYQRGHYPSAQKQFTALAKRGNAWAMYNLSAMHAQREAKPSSEKQAKHWLVQSAALGYAQAQYVLGQSYEGGQYGEKNIVKAVTYYALAAQQGNSAAQIEFATALFLGRGVTADLNLAGEWYLSAARAGELEAQTIVARMFETGEGRPQDDRMARYWYKEAAKRGDLPSQAKMFAYERDDAKSAVK